MYPSTLSKAVIAELGSESNYPSAQALADKLDKKPALLFSFFSSAMQSLQWNKTNGALKFQIINRLTANIISGRLPFDESIARCFSIFQVHLNFAGIFSLSDFILETPEGKLYLSKIILMRSSPVLQTILTRNPQLSSETLAVLAPELKSSDDMTLIYNLFTFDDYSDFYNLHATVFQRILNQCKRWICPQLNTLEELFAKRICDFFTACSKFAYARYRGLNRLEGLAKNYLDNSQFLVLENSNFYIYMLYAPVVEDPKVLKLFAPFEIVQMSSELLSSGYDGNMRIKALQLAMTVRFKSRLSIASIPCSHIQSVDAFKKAVSNKRQAKLETSNIRTISFVGNYKLDDLVLVGILLHFELVRRVELVEYTDISLVFLSMLSIKNLNHVAITDYKGSLETTLPLIPAIMPHVYSLEINCIMTKGSVLNGKILTSLLKLGTITHLQLTNVSIEVPHDLEVLECLKGLSLIRVNANDEVIQTYLNHCTNLEKLYLSVENTKLNFPLSLAKLAITASLLIPGIVKGRIPSIDNLDSLEKLVVVGEMEPLHVQVLQFYSKSRSIEIQFANSFEFLDLDNL